MQLTQSESANPIVFKGKGYIKQLESGGILFKIYVYDSINIDMIKSFNKSGKSIPGKMLPSDEYYSLMAASQDGKIWKAEGILPKDHWTYLDKNPIITGDISKLSTESSMTGPNNALRLHFFDFEDVPIFGDEYKFSRNNVDFIIKTLNKGFTFQIESNKSISTEYSNRIQEALWFVLGRTVICRATEFQSNGIFQLHLTKPESNADNVRLHPPLLRRPTPTFVTDSWNLFYLYLDYAIRNTQGGYWNYITYHLSNARNASAGSLDAWVYGMCIAVEAVAHLINPKAEIKDKGQIVKLQNVLKKEIEKRKTLQSYSRRVTDLIGSMLERRPVDKLNDIVSIGGANVNHIKKWTKMRNKFVRPKKTELKILNEQAMQDLVDAINTVNLLLNHIIFYLIEYKGTYSDYSKVGFPINNYPLPEHNEK